MPREGRNHAKRTKDIQMQKLSPLCAALEELTGMRWVMTDKPKEAADE
jgi:hypothetical protein